MKTVIIYEPEDIQMIKTLLHDGIINLSCETPNYNIVSTIDKMETVIKVLTGEELMAEEEE